MSRPGRGYTLLEVFIALLLISFVFFVMATLFPTSIGSLRKGTTTTVASNLARQQMEYWKSQTFDVLKAAQPTPSVQTVEGINYTERVTISRPSDPNMINLSVWVTWDGDNYGQYGVTYTTGVFNVVNPF
ncbi:MAG TPA: type II secretion system protein [Candidatus Xenobia bacterium]